MGIGNHSTVNLISGIEKRNTRPYSDHLFGDLPFYSQNPLLCLTPPAFFSMTMKKDGRQLKYNVWHAWNYSCVVSLTMITNDISEIRRIRNEGTALANMPCKDLALLTPSLPAKQENNRKRRAEFH